MQQFIENLIENFMMTSSNGDIFRVTGLLCGEFTGRRWIPPTKASDTELWCFRWSAPEQTVELTIEALVIGDAIVPFMTSLYVDEMCVRISLCNSSALQAYMRNKAQYMTRTPFHSRFFRRN